MFDEGISASGDLIDLAVADDVVNKSGAWFSYGEVRLGQGRENAKQFLRENPDLFEEIRLKVLDAKGLLHVKKPAETIEDKAVGQEEEAKA
jgi:recombination protein RecA